jgi:AraC family transcriptional regulator
MREESASRTLQSGIGGSFTSTPFEAERLPPPAASISERLGRLVRRAMMFLESDRRAAWRCLNDASALLGQLTEDWPASDPVPSGTFQPGGLARWQARRAVTYIEAHLESKLDVHALAALVSFSKSHFSRAFRRSLGLPPMAYVMTRRVEKARVLMTSTRQQLTEIALICGFADQSHLNRSFRRIIGVSPGKWRRTNVEMVSPPSPLRDERALIRARAAPRAYESSTLEAATW